MPKESEAPNDLVVSSQLITVHGFTRQLVGKLGEPDLASINPHYKSGPPMKLYSLKRALRFKEKHPSLFEKAKARKRSAAKGVSTKLARLYEKLDGMGLKFTRELPSTIAELYAIANKHAQSRYDNAWAPGMNGIIATVRHEFTNYEECLAAIRGRVGSGDAYDEIRAELDMEVRLALWSAYGIDAKQDNPSLIARAPDDRPPS